jgi:hypothetical protein
MINSKLTEALMENRGLSVVSNETFKTIENHSYNIRSRFKAKSFLVLPISLFEILVCYLGFKFYQTIGFDKFSAFSLSFATECFYMYFSSRRGTINTGIRVLFLTVSIFTLSYNAYIKDPNLVTYKEGLGLEKGSLLERMNQISAKLKDSKNEMSLLRTEMGVYIKNELITKGNRVLGPRRNYLNRQTEKLLIERNQLNRSLKKLNVNSTSIPIIKQLSILTVRTLITVLVFSLIQIAICISLPDVIDSFKKKIGTI